MTHQDYLDRCYALARKARNNVKSNPNVGAVVVAEGRIIGEGYHRKYGEAHAEVNAIDSIAASDLDLLPSATLYVSLEPCSHHGKTPPCSDLIIKNKIPAVHIGCQDPFDKVNGSGIKRLQEAGIEVFVHDDPTAYETIAPFLAIHQAKRPYITLKWAQSKNGHLGQKNKQVWLSNAYTKVLSHKLRATHDAIVVGVNTMLTDNPSLTTRHFPGASPIPIVIDPNDRWTTSSIHRKDMIVINNQLMQDYGTPSIEQTLMTYCMMHNLHRVLIEGGAFTLRQLIKNELWDQAYIYRTPVSITQDAIKAPSLQGRLIDKQTFVDNEILHIRNEKRP